MSTVTLPHLKRVGVHQRHQCSVADEDIGLVHVSNTISARVQCLHGSSEIVCSAV